MRLAWLTKLPTMGMPVRGEGATTLFTDVFPKASIPSSLPVDAPAKPKPETQKRPPLLARLATRLRSVFQRGSDSSKAITQLFQLADQRRRQWMAQVEAYAESPFEKALFSLEKKTGDYVISKAWANGIRSSDPITRDAALALFKAYLAYTRMENTDQLSSHTQMKLLLFSPHLSEGALGKVILYEAILSLPMAQMMDWILHLRYDFHHLPPIGQALLLKQLMLRWKNRDKKAPAEENRTLKKLVKTLVIQFYTSKNEALDQVLTRQEKIRLGFLKIQPIEDDYHKQLEEIERRYRFKLRQLKKRRAMKVAEVEEEKIRRLELVYDSVEENLMAGLTAMELNLEELLAAV